MGHFLTLLIQIFVVPCFKAKHLLHKIWSSDRLQQTNRRHQVAEEPNVGIIYLLQTLQQSFAVIHLFFKWANPGLFLFNFVLLKYKFYRKTVSISGNQTRTVGEEGEHADHLTTTTALLLFNLWRKKLRPIRFTIYHLATLRCRRYQVSLTSWLVYLFDIWPFVTMKMCQSRFKIEPNII